MSILTSPALRYPKSLWSYNPSPTGCVLYLPLWHPSLSGPVFKDIGPSGATCTVTSATYGVTGRTFDGASGIITVPDVVPIQNIFDSGGALVCWINAASAGEGPYGHIALKIWELIVRDEAASKVKLQFSATFSGDNGVWATNATVLDINTWYHVVITYDNSHVDNNPIIYVDTSSVAISAGQPTGTRTTDVATNLTIGNRVGDDRTWDGVIGEIRLYDRLLSATAVVDDYNTTKFRYT